MTRRLDVRCSEPPPDKSLDASGASLFRKCVANGVTIIKPITATEWGTKGFYVEDPDGYIIGFGGRPAAG